MSLACYAHVTAILDPAIGSFGGYFTELLKTKDIILKDAVSPTRPGGRFEGWGSGVFEPRQSSKMGRRQIGR